MGERHSRIPWNANRSVSPYNLSAYEIKYEEGDMKSRWTLDFSRCPSLRGRGVEKERPTNIIAVQEGISSDNLVSVQSPFSCDTLTSITLHRCICVEA
jgi:hypothetical protein